MRSAKLLIVLLIETIFVKRPMERVSTTISKKAKRHLTQLIIYWQAEIGKPLTIEGALSDLVLSIPVHTPYPAPSGNGKKPKEEQP